MPPSPLFGRLAEIGARVASAPGVILVSDFDGTLAPIAAVPEEASLPPVSRRLLAEISALDGITVAVVSGRAIEDVRARVGIERITYAGNHGLEVSGPGLEFLEPRAAALQGALGEIAAALATALRDVPGARVEDKRLTLSVHLRRVEPGRVEEARRIVEDVAGEAAARLGGRIRLAAGRKILEVRPRIDWDKGAAAALIRDRLAAPGALAISLGDDATDEDMFRALADGITIRIGRSGDTCAELFAEEPAEVERFLGWLVESIRGQGGRG